MYTYYAHTQNKSSMHDKSK